MAKNREPEKHVESDPETGEEEEEEEDEEGSSEEVESEPEPEPEQTQGAKKPSSSTLATLKKPHPPSSSKAQQQPQKPDSSSSEEDEFDSDSETDSDENPRNVKPLASKPMDDPQKSKPKAKAPEPNTPVKSTGVKRSAAEEKEAAEKESKRSKKKPETEPDNSEKKSGGTSDSSKKVLFQRLWSEEDEIVILKGILDYTAKYKSSPSSDIDAFHDFIRKNLHIDVSKIQLQDKMRRLKKKYENNKSKEKPGKDRNFSKPHEQKAYELSKKIWGTENGKANDGEKAMGSPKANGGTARKNTSKKAVESTNVIVNGLAADGNTMEVSNVDVEKSTAAKRVHSGGLSGHEKIMRIGAELFEGDDVVDGQKEWRKLIEDEIELHLKQLDLMRAQAKLVLDVLKSNNH